MNQPSTQTVVKQTVEIAAAYIGNNPMAPGDIPNLLRTIYGAVTGLSTAAPALTPQVELVPAIPIKKSVTPDYLVCLEDGRKMRTLKRHLRTSFGLTPEEYRKKWNLPPDYPMVAPNYSTMRSEMARDIGLGRRSNKPGPAPVKRRGRRAAA